MTFNNRYLVLLGGCLLGFFLLRWSSTPYIQYASDISESQVRVLTVENDANWPFYHTSLELTYPGFNQTFGFFSTMKNPSYWLYGWQNHPGKIINPDLFVVGSGNGTITPGRVVSDICINLNATQTWDLIVTLVSHINNPGLYSYINRGTTDNCASWVVRVLNPILDGVQVDCSVARWLPIQVPRLCRLVQCKESFNQLDNDIYNQLDNDIYENSVLNCKLKDDAFNMPFPGKEELDAKLLEYEAKHS